MDEVQRLEQAMAALDAQRTLLGDAVVEAGMAPMREKLLALRAAQVAAEPKRKQVTVLFADVSGFTALAETLDAEEVSETMNGLWQRLDAVIKGHGGVIDKHIGDAVMALWGVQVSHEDDPERAIRAALDMQTAVTAFAATTPYTLQLRIGINTGPVLLGEVGTQGEFTAMGDTVNVASRLESAAPVGKILISHDTYRHVRGVFQVEGLPPLPLKGKAEPVPVYVVLEALPRAFRRMTRGVEGIETRLVGRAEEMAHLQHAWHTVVANRCLRALLITGEAGVGKTRLLLEFRDWTVTYDNSEHWQNYQEQGLWLFRARSTRERQAIPYALWRDFFSFRFEILESDASAVVRDKLESGFLRFFADHPLPQEEVVMRAHYVGHLVGFDLGSSFTPQGSSQQIREQAFRYMTELLASAMRTHPAALYLEDIHWADKESLGLLAHLLQACREQPLFVLCLTRPDFGETASAQDLLALFDSRLFLPPLTLADTQVLIGEILHKIQPIPPILSDLIAQHAEGNPFYVEELVKMLTEEGVIVKGEEHWLVNPSQLVRLRVPSTLTGILQARLDSLLPVEQEVLQQAAVIGRTFWEPALSAMRRDPLGSGVLGGILEHLQERDLIRRRKGSSFAGLTEYSFRHALLREVIYESTLKRHRRQYHSETALWFVNQVGERAEEFAGQIAQHYELASRGEEAALWYGRAGHHAMDSSPQMALAYYEQALSLLPHTSEKEAARLPLLEGKGQMLRQQARHEEAIQSFQDMLEIAKHLKDGTSQVRALNHLAMTDDIRRDHPNALRYALEAERVAAGAGEETQADLAGALWLAGVSCFRLGDLAAAKAKAEQALALSEAINAQRVVARSQSLLGWIHDSAGRYQEAGNAMRQALIVFRQLKYRQGISIMLNNLAVSAALQGDYQAALPLFQEALSLARDLNVRSLEAAILTNLGGIGVGLTDFSGAENQLRASLQLAQESKQRGSSETYRYLAEALLGQGRKEEAWTAALTALCFGYQSGRKEHVGSAWRALGQILCQSRAGEFVDAALPDEEMPEELGVELSELEPHLCFSRSLQLFEEIGVEVEQARTLRLWAQRVYQQGEVDKAQSMWQAAWAIFERMGLSAELERMKLGLG